MKKATRKKTKSVSRKSLKKGEDTAAHKRGEMLATADMLYEAREELGYKITSVDLKVDAAKSELSGKIDAVDKKVDAVDKKVDAVDKKVDAVKVELSGKIDAVDRKVDSVKSELGGKIDAGFSAMDSKLSRMQADIHKVLFIVEEQRAENRTVWDKQHSLEVRQDRLEEDVQDLRGIVDGLVKSS